MSDARRLRLEVVLAAVDKATRPLRNLMGAHSDLARAVKATRAQLKDLERTQAGIDSFRKLSRDAAITSTQLKTVRGRADELARQLRATSDPSAALTKSFEAAKREAQALKARQSELSEKLHQVRGRLAEAGIGTQNLAQHQRALRSRIASTNEQLETQTQRMAAVTAQQRRMAAAHQAADKVRARAGNVAAAGAGATAAGMAAGAPLLKGLGEAKHYDLEKLRIGALGLGDPSTKDALAFAEQMKAYGVSQVEKAELMRDALSVFADTHHAEMVMPTLAKMKFANAAVFGQAEGAENERKFVDMLKVIELRGGLASEDAFKKQADMVQQVISATGGRVQAGEWLQVIKRGGLAAKGMDSEAFYYTLEPLVQEMDGATVGTAMMSAYQNLYQGKTTKRALHNLDKFGLIADRSKVQEDKAGQVSFMDPGALKGAELFRKNQFAWVEQVLLPALAAKGITSQAQVQDVIGSILPNRTASNLISQMVVQRDQIHKNMRLNAGAAGIDQLEAKAKGTAQGQELDTLAKVHDLEKALGEKVLPLYARGLELVTQAAVSVTAFMQDHPTLAKAAAVAVGALAASLLVLGPGHAGRGVRARTLRDAAHPVRQVGRHGRRAVGRAARPGARLQRGHACRRRAGPGAAAEPHWPAGDGDRRSGLPGLPVLGAHQRFLLRALATGEGGLRWRHHGRVRADPELVTGRPVLWRARAGVAVVRVRRAGQVHRVRRQHRAGPGQRHPQRNRLGHRRRCQRGKRRDRGLQRPAGHPLAQPRVCRAGRVHHGRPGRRPHARPGWAAAGRAIGGRQADQHRRRHRDRRGAGRGEPGALRHPGAAGRRPGCGHRRGAGAGRVHHHRHQPAGGER
ncbi:hypothetical protein [Ralstonia solanacearum]|uniref:hypothetical protein n=1 Tax=Ralstonia solanacearum TaxID=305 RepID=UPI001E3CB447|nr:hypothetical protein [Ralstonia solanacearum]